MPDRISALPLPPEPEPEPEPEPSPSMGSPQAWNEAMRFRMRRVLILTLVLCAGGAALLGAIAVHRLPLYVAWACLAGIAVALVIHNRVWSLGPGSWWAWTVAAVLSVGPAYSVGLHSGFAAIASALLFLGGLFRASDRASHRDHRGRVYVGTALSHGAAFLLIWTGVLPDLGNVPVMVSGTPAWQILLQHVLLQGVYFASYQAGVRVDARHAALMMQAEAATRRAARQQAMLAAATAAIDRVLGPAADAIFVGAKVGRFRLERLLGRGGMGDVYEAVDEAGTRAAVKLIRRDRAADPRSLDLFATEARALARVNSENVARVFDVGGVESELPYIAMELVQGRTLASILKEQKQLPLEDLRGMIRDVAQGLRDVHEAGILHRDVKPQNVVRNGEGDAARWKLLDFGVAQIHDLVGPTDSLIAGTPRYMAPEQARGERVDVRADLYSFCLVIYRALTGRPAYVGSDHLELVRMAATEAAPDPRWYVAVPRDVERVLRVGLAAKPEDRFASAGELAAAFEDAWEGRLSREHQRRAEEVLAREPWSRPGRVVLPAETPDPSTAISPG
jgi:serine/threonine-protein kinase